VGREDKTKDVVFEYYISVVLASFRFFFVVVFFGNNLELSLSSLLYYISVFNHSADKTITKSKEDREWCFQKTCIWGRQQPSIHLPVCGGG
jgi:hypothetical protein